MQTKNEVSAAFLILFILSTFIVAYVYVQAYRRTNVYRGGSMTVMGEREREREEREKFEDAIQATGLTVDQWRDVLDDHTDPVLVADYVKGNIETTSFKGLDANRNKLRMPRSFESSQMSSGDKKNDMRSDYYVTRRFTRVGKHEFPVPADRRVEVLVVGGGGAGGRSASTSFGQGGGGGGGVVYVKNYVIPPSLGNTMSLTVGDGGFPDSSPHGGPGGNGQNSVFDALVAQGGGGGGYYRMLSRDRQIIIKGRDGASGGGNATNTTEGRGTKSGTSNATQPTSDSEGYGNRGGKDIKYGGGAGGGGAGSAGRSPKQEGWGGNGGHGRLIPYFDRTPVFYGAGGGGGAQWDRTAGVGGRGGGGNASTHYVNEDTQELIVKKNATPGEAETGGGGGAMKIDDKITGYGGSGIIIVRFKAYQKRTSNGALMFPVDEFHRPENVSEAIGTSFETPSFPLPEHLDITETTERNRYLILSKKHFRSEDEKEQVTQSPFKHVINIHYSHPGFVYYFDIPFDGKFTFQFYTVLGDVYDGGTFLLSLGSNTRSDSEPDFEKWVAPSNSGWNTWKTTWLRKGSVKLRMKTEEDKPPVFFGGIMVKSNVDQWHHHTDWRSGNLGPNKSVDSISDCMANCRTDDSCAGFTYDAEEGKCQLKRSMPESNATEKKNHHSWTKSS